MISFPNCKINIGLSVIEKRTDGFHNIESIFYPIDWCDILEIIKSNSFEFSQTGINTGEGTNLCVKAYQLLKEQYHLPDVKIHLHKIIPIGAGLGGGSSDAAFTIKTLNALFALNLSVIQMKEHAAAIGSDCSFFIENKPVLASGKGEILNDIVLDLKKYHIVIVFPNIFISTTEAFSEIAPSKKAMSLSNRIKIPIGGWKNKIINDFEVSTFIKHPLLKTIKEHLYEIGANYASMSGSGSAVYGIFENKVGMMDELNVHSFLEKYQVFECSLSF